MKKDLRVKKNYDFETIINQGKKVYGEFYIIYMKKNELETPRFGISVGKKLGNAVFRNKLKRQLRNIINNDIINNISVNNDIIIIVKKKCIKLTYKEKQKHLENILKKAKIYRDSVY